MQFFAYCPAVPGTVLNILDLPDGAALAANVAAAFVPHLYPCAATVTDGWTYDGTAFTAPAAAAAPTTADLVAYAEDKQVALRDGGITVNVGTSAAPQLVDVASDVNGRSLVSGCVQLSGLASANNQPAPTFPWINNDGSAVTLTGAQMMTIGYALGAFVQATYATLGTVLAAIANGTLTSTAGIDAASWPATAA